MDKMGARIRPNPKERKEYIGDKRKSLQAWKKSGSKANGQIAEVLNKSEATNADQPQDIDDTVGSVVETKKEIINVFDEAWGDAPYIWNFPSDEIAAWQKLKHEEHERLKKRR